MSEVNRLDILESTVGDIKNTVADHTKDIVVLKLAGATVSQQVINLVKSVDGLVSVIKWALGLTITIGLGLLAIYFK